MTLYEMYIALTVTAFPLLVTIILFLVIKLRRVNEERLRYMGVCFASPLIRPVFPNLIAKDITKVDPLPPVDPTAPLYCRSDALHPPLDKTIDECLGDNLTGETKGKPK
jgi:hypothetical protein